MPDRALLIRADADERVGAGHVMRCLALAQAWLDAREGPVWLASSALPDAVRDRYASEGARIRMVAPGPSGLSAAVDETGAAWVVLDGYEFAPSDQEVVKDLGRRLLVVDDDGVAGAYAADLVLDPNVFADERPYSRRAASTRLLLGPRYALIRRELVGSPAPSRPRDAARVLVTFGGSDPHGLSSMAVRALTGLGSITTVVLGPANARRDEVDRLAAAVPDVRVVSSASNMRELMDAADVAVAGAGGTCLELAHAGVPQLVVVSAENQRRVAESMAALGVARSLGAAAELTPERLRDAVTSLLADPAARSAMSARGAALVDGLGAARVVAAMR